MPERNNNKLLMELKDLESLSILQLLYLLKPPQVWAVLVILFGLISGAISLGYKISNLVSEVELVRYQTENSGLLKQMELTKSSAEAKIERYKTETKSLQEKIRQFRAMQTKERFLALYLRYLIAKNALADNESQDNEKAVAIAGDSFSNYIDELLARGESASNEIDLRGIYLGKGGGEIAAVVFGYDGTKWVIPSEFGFAAKR